MVFGKVTDSTTLKTISMYLRAAKTEAEDAGESTDGMASSVSKLRDEILALTGNEVDIQIDEDTFKSSYQILQEIAGVWDELTDISRANILEMLGGKRNANAVSALITNFNTAEAALDSAANSAGSALAENDKYLDSINGRVAKLSATFESLSAHFVDTDFVKGIITLGTNAVSVLDAFVSKLGAVPTAVSAITAAIASFRAAKGKGTGIFDITGSISSAEVA